MKLLKYTSLHSLVTFDLPVALQVGKMEMPFCAENVCMELDEEGTQLYAVGSRSHVTLIDSRQRHKSAGTINSIDTDCGEERGRGHNWAWQDVLAWLPPHVY